MTAGSCGGKIDARTNLSTVSSGQSKPIVLGASLLSGKGDSFSAFGRTPPSTRAATSCAAASACLARSEMDVSSFPTCTLIAPTSSPPTARTETRLLASCCQMGANSGQGAPFISDPARMMYLPVPADSRAFGSFPLMSGTHTVRSALKLAKAPFTTSSSRALAKPNPSSTQRLAKIDVASPAPKAKTRQFRAARGPRQAAAAVSSCANKTTRVILLPRNSRKRFRRKG
mmetsp:Transcript_6382/g.11972  ORF Transcript_6382/g.11972 Transcript_6382/m.11972 type:complete len:229 (+) Transcript_6382:1614-2300(+)